MKEEDKKEVKKIANEEMDKRVKPKEVKTCGDPIVEFKD